MMPVAVSDSRSSPADQIAHAAKIIGRSPQRTAIFKAIYHGKKRIKTVQELHQTTGFSRKRVLEEARKLVKNLLVSQTKRDGDTAYEKDSFYDAQKAKILSLAKRPDKLARFATKVTPRPIESRQVTIIKIPRQRIRAHLVTIDDIESFSRVRKQREATAPIPMLEEKFKEGVKRILKESGRFKDWGGERNDLLTTRLRLKGKRRAAAFAFKGRGRRGKLTPGKMGKNGDQIQRLFQSPADVFLVQYWDQIDESILQQMGEFAKAKSAGDCKEIFYGVVDGQDSNRIVKAYPNAF